MFLLQGVARGRALYDTPPPGSQSGELARSSRSRVCTERAKAGFGMQSNSSDLHITDSFI